jgi:hypothetical protein
MIAHGEEYYKTYFADRPDESLIPSAVEITRRAGAYVTPNLSFFHALTARTADPAVGNVQLSAPEVAFIPPDIRANWLPRTDKGSDRFVAELGLIRKLTLALSQAGVPLLTGTDTPLPGLVPGFSLADDLEQLVAAGLSPYQAMTAATRSPGRFIDQFVPGAERFGTIEVGKRADLVLLAANPLTDIRNVRAPVGVMVRGRWFDAGELKSMAARPVPAYERVMAREADFEKTLRTKGVQAAVLADERRPKGRDILPETYLNSVGYRLLSAKKTNEAIAVFRLNTVLYPNSWNAYDSLGEACAGAGLRDQAIACYRRSLAINPQNVGAQRFLEKAAGW